MISDQSDRNFATPDRMIHRKRTITGMSAILLPFLGQEVDWAGFEAHVLRTAEAGLIPAVNMDTGYITLIGEDVRREVLRRTAVLLGGRRFVAGSFVSDREGDSFKPDSYKEMIDEVARVGGTPVIMQSFGLSALPEEAIPGAYSHFAEECDEFIAFELGADFAHFGRIYSLDTYREIVRIGRCIGAKHSSLSRELEWQRLAVRDAVRPDFLVLTGNDLAIDMVMYGSDYLLGLSTFAPDLFALRDRFWAAGEPSFYELNDVLQFLGCFAFRNPVPAYKSSAAQFLKLQQWIGSDDTMQGSRRRPGSDIEVLSTILTSLNQWRERL